MPRTRTQPAKGAARNNRDFSKSAVKRRMIEAEKRAQNAAAYAEAMQRKLNQVFAMREMSAELGAMHEKLEQIRVACKRGGLSLKKNILEILAAGTEYTGDELKAQPEIGEGASDE